MDLTASLLAVASVYCQAKGWSKARLGAKVANDGKFFTRVEGGGGITTRTYERAMLWMSDNWPAGAEWPRGIARPARSPVAA